MEQERFLLKISTNLFIVSDYEGAVSYASPKAVLLFGFSDIKDARLSSCLSRENWLELRRHFSDVLLTKIPGYFTLRHQNRFSTSIFTAITARRPNAGKTLPSAGSFPGPCTGPPSGSNLPKKRQALAIGNWTLRPENCIGLLKCIGFLA